MAAPNVRSINSHRYVLYILFNPPEARVGHTVEFLKSITLEMRGVFPARYDGVDGFKIVNLYSEIQTDPKCVNVYDKNSTDHPAAWSQLCSDRNCVAICAAWGEIRGGEREVRARRIEVARWLNRHHSGKVGTLGLSRAGFPYHPNSDVFRRDRRPQFRIEPIPER